MTTDDKSVSDLLPCPLCDMYLRKATDPRLAGMIEHPANLHCPISALAFVDTLSNRAAWNRRSPPSGYRLVPVEPTEAMIEAHFAAHAAAATVFADVPTIWAAMIEAAPSPKDQHPHAASAA